VTPPLLSAFGRGSGDRNLASFRLVTEPGAALLAPLIIAGIALTLIISRVTFALLITSALVALRVLLLLRCLAIRLTLLLRLIHGVKDTEVMLRMLEERLGRHPVAAARRIATKLKVFFEKLLGRAANTDLRPVAVENVVPIERDAAPRRMADRAAGPTVTTAATTATRAMVAATHALHVHTVAVVLSHCRWACGSVGRSIRASPGSSLGQPRSIGVDSGSRRAH